MIELFEMIFCEVYWMPTRSFSMLVCNMVHVAQGPGNTENVEFSKVPKTFFCFFKTSAFFVLL